MNITRSIDRNHILGGQPLVIKYLLHELNTIFFVMSQNSYPTFMICFKHIFYFNNNSYLTKKHFFLISNLPKSNNSIILKILMPLRKYSLAIYYIFSLININNINLLTYTQIKIS